MLDYAAIRAAGALVLRTTGVERESTLAFSGLFSLVTPLADVLLAMPPARSATLAAVMGLSGTAEETVPDRFRVATQLMMLLASAAERRPLLVLVDDAQWLDRPSSDALLFAARRLQAEAVAVLITVRDGDPVDFPTSGLDELPRRGPARSRRRRPARPRWQGTGAGGPDPAPGRGKRKPLALLEIPGSLSREQLRGDAPLPETIPLSPRIRRMFHDRIGRLPEATRTALVLAAADNTGDAGVVVRAAAALGLPGDSLDPAENAALVRTHDGRITFRHPLVRAAVYDGATLSDRRAAHTALARVLPGEGTPTAACGTGRWPPWSTTRGSPRRWRSRRGVPPAGPPMPRRPRPSCVPRSSVPTAAGGPGGWQPPPKPCGPPARPIRPGRRRRAPCPSPRGSRPRACCV